MRCGCSTTACSASIRRTRTDPDRDRFILSKGHGPAAFYAVLAAKGFFPEHELDGFLSWASRLGSHPDRRQVPGVEASTGSLGHGLPLAVGVALAMRAKGKTDRRVVVLCGDAELNEGSNWEAIFLAPHLHLDGADAPRDRQPQLVDRDGAVAMRGSARSGGTWPWSAGTIARRSPRRSSRRPGRAERRHRRHPGGRVVMDMRTQLAETATDLLEHDPRTAVVLADISVERFERAFTVAPDPRGQRRDHGADADRRRRPASRWRGST